MKQCPTCTRTYADDTLAFCLDDGTPLIVSHDPQATLVMHPPRTAELFEGAISRQNKLPVETLIDADQSVIKKKTARKMTKLLEEVDRSLRPTQNIGILASSVLALIALQVIHKSLFPLGIALIMPGIVVVWASIRLKQKWETEYKGHKIRFENSHITGEKLFLDDALVAKGGFGIHKELRASIKVGYGVGDEIMVLSEAGFLSFRCRIFIEERQ